MEFLAYFVLFVFAVVIGIPAIGYESADMWARYDYASCFKRGVKNIISIGLSIGLIVAVFWALSVAGVYN